VNGCREHSSASPHNNTLCKHGNQHVEMSRVYTHARTIARWHAREPLISYWRSLLLAVPGMRRRRRFPSPTYLASCVISRRSLPPARTLGQARVQERARGRLESSPRRRHRYEVPQTLAGQRCFCFDAFQVLNAVPALFACRYCEWQTALTTTRALWLRRPRGGGGGASYLMLQC
jgi:hypothetical protein